MLIFLKVIYRINAVTLKIPIEFFTEVGKNPIPKIHKHIKPLPQFSKE